MKIAKNLMDLIGNTPLMELSNYAASIGLENPLVAKLERMNPLYSVKDRVGAALIEDAEKKGLIGKDTLIIEPTGGNTGIGLAFVCAIKGYRAVFTMPETMSVERQKLLKALGMEVVLTPAADSTAGAMAAAQRIHEENPDSIIAGQFISPANPGVHYETTGPEIWRDTDGAIDVFVAGFGTGGTLTGTARYLKEKNPAVEVIGFEPASSPMLTEGWFGPHKMMGIGTNFVPELLDRSLIDEILTVTDEDACACVKALARTEGLLVGITSGAAVCAAEKMARRPGYAKKCIVALLPDTGERYLSTGVYD